MHFNALPREIQIQIFQCFDMEARIKTGFIGKLKTPDDFKNSLNKFIMQRIKGLQRDTITIPISHNKHYECHYDVGYNRDVWRYVDATNSTNTYGCPDITLLHPKLKVVPYVN
jgi:hypothetical protein